MLKKEDFHLLKMFILKMKENIIEAQYDITKKTKIRKFYEAYKILIFSSVLVITILFGSIGYYYNLHGKKKILMVRLSVLKLLRWKKIFTIIG